MSQISNLLYGINLLYNLRSFLEWGAKSLDSEKISKFILSWADTDITEKKETICQTRVDTDNEDLLW
jgi:hypothetical protein